MLQTLTKLARTMVVIIAVEDFAIAAMFAATKSWRLAAFWFTVGLTNLVASTIS